MGSWGALESLEAVSADSAGESALATWDVRARDGRSGATWRRAGRSARRRAGALRASAGAPIGGGASRYSRSCLLFASLREPSATWPRSLSGVASQHPRKRLIQELAPRPSRPEPAPDERPRAPAGEGRCRPGSTPAREFPGGSARRMAELAMAHQALGEPSRRRVGSSGRRAPSPRVLAFEEQRPGHVGAVEGRRYAPGATASSEHPGRRSWSSPSRGISWQAQLVLGALPQRLDFPGARARPMFAPAESRPFAIDVSLNAATRPMSSLSGSRAGGFRTPIRSCARSPRGAGRRTSVSSAPRKHETAVLSPGRQPTSVAPCHALHRRRGPRARPSSSGGSRCAAGRTARFVCIGRSGISCSCSCSTSQASGRGSSATTTPWPPSRWPR